MTRDSQMAQPESPIWRLSSWTDGDTGRDRANACNNTHM